MRNIKYYILLIFMLQLSPNVWSQNEIIIPLSSVGQRGKLEVDTHRSRVTVKGTNRSDVMVSYEVKGEKTQGLVDAGNGLKRITGVGSLGLQITEDDNEVRVETEHNSNAEELIIEVPINFDLEINTHHNGQVNIDNINGEIVVDTHHGGVKATRIAGTVVADSWHGNLIVEYTNMTNDKAQAFTTYHGRIDLTLPASTKANLKMKSSRGEIFTGFDVSLQKSNNRSEQTKDGKYKVVLDDWVTGTINGGGSEIKMETRGNIYVRKA
ncbi:MAG: DUF4097 family beta strand repeat-containing protein [Bacteroidota bacterium]